MVQIIGSVNPIELISWRRTEAKQKRRVREVRKKEGDYTANNIPKFAQLWVSADSLRLLDINNMCRSFWSFPPLICNIINVAKPHLQHIVEPSLKIQKQVYSAVFSATFLQNLSGVFNRRCSKYFYNDGLTYDDVKWSDVFHICHKIGHQFIVTIFKTLTGAWLTHRRVQSTPRCCIFCQCAEDSLQHVFDNILGPDFHDFLA